MAEEAGEIVYVDLTDGHELVINRITSGAFFGSLHTITLGTSQVRVRADGSLEEQCAIVARLRFDTEMAITLREALSRGIAAVTPPSNEKPN
jgi:hypothetical protein